MAKIMGNIVGLPSPRSDWNQDNPLKADYIKNRPLNEINAVKSLKHYGDSNIVPSDEGLFEFVMSPMNDGAALAYVASTLPKDIVIPYEATVDEETLPITFLWDIAFAGWDITSIILPDTIKEIGVQTFEGASITSITIPESVKTICSNAFNGCSKLENVYYRGTKAQWDAITIADSNDALTNATIYYEWSDVTKDYVDEKIGDIDSALEELHNYAQALIGGEA